MFVKQHAVIDVLAGLLTALARGTVLDDVGVVKAHLAAEHANGKFVLVNFGT